MQTSNRAPNEPSGDQLQAPERQDWQAPTLETIETQRLVAALASCQESAPSATNDPFCSNDCP